MCKVGCMGRPGGAGGLRARRKYTFLAADACFNLHGGERKPLGCLNISLQERVLPAGLSEAAGQAGQACAPLASKGGTHCSWDNSVEHRSRAARVSLAEEETTPACSEFSRFCLI